MRKLTTTLCLIIAVFFGGSGCKSTHMNSDFDHPDYYRKAMNAMASNEWVKARELLRPITRSGYRPAQYNLGVLYYQGKGIAQDYSKAAEWLSRAAKQGVARAQNNLGTTYLHGNGVTYNHKVAESWFKRSADQGTAAAQYNLVKIYEGGYDVKQNYEKAAYWYSRAADQGHKKSIDRLLYLKKENRAECLYLKNCFTITPAITLDVAMQTLKNGDYSGAFEQLQNLAENGNRDAAVMLGQMYNKGRGVKPNFDMALKWWRQAAEQGSRPAQYKLGVMYAAGKGVDADYIKGLMWLRVAELGGYNFQAIPNLQKLCLTRLRADSHPHNLKKHKTLPVNVSVRNTKGAE